MSDDTLSSSTYNVSGMDCAAEEQLVRMKLADEPAVQRLRFDLAQRTVVITHRGEHTELERLMQELNLGAVQVGHVTIDALPPAADDAQQRTLLIVVLLINAALFVLELTTGWLAGSMGLIADSLDMLADALVYGLSLYAVGKAAVQKRRVARLSGYAQLLLAVFGMVEVLRRFVGAGDEPRFTLMIVVSLIALAGNVAALLVLQRTQSQDVHIRASWIFTTNDVLVNLGVIVAGVLVFVSGSRLPDLVIGALVFALVGSGALRILRLAAPSTAAGGTA